MIDIVTEKGEMYSFNPETERVFKNGLLLSSVVVEPLYSANDGANPPVFSGLYLKEKGMVISLSGKMSTLTDPNTI